MERVLALQAGEIEPELPGDDLYFDDWWMKLSEMNVDGKLMEALSIKQVLGVTCYHKPRVPHITNPADQPKTLIA